MFLILTGGANACGDVAGPGRLPDVSEYVSGLAEEALDGTGRFVFVDSVRTDGHERIDFARARELALSFVHTFWTYDFSLGGSEGDGLQSLLERQRGAPIDAVYRATGMRTVEPPVLLFPPIGFGLSVAKWRLKLEAPVTVNVDGAERQTTDVLYSGWWPGGSRTTLFVASAEQPVHWSQTWNDPVPGESIELVVPVRGDNPVEFDLVAGAR